MAEDIRQEFSGIDLSDSRRDRRLLELVSALAKDPQSSICAATGGWAETMGAYRLFNNKKVTPAGLLAPHQAAAVRRCEGFPCVVLAQDTTEMDFTAMKSTEGLGPLNEEKRRGFFLHGLYAVSEQGLPLGVLGAEIILRDDKNFRITSTRKHRPIEEKESFRWVEGYRKTCELARAVPGCEVFSVSDREGDIFEVFEAWQSAGERGEARAEWLIRANQDRALLNVAKDDPCRLFAALEAAPELGRIEFKVVARAAKRVKKKGEKAAAPRSARTVIQSLRAIEITPRPPERPGGRGRPVSIYAILAQEVDPPPGEQALRWVLLTSKPVRTAQDAERMVKLYLRRWDIEVFHRVLKTGCKVEQIQLQTIEALLRALMVYLVIAWRVLYLTHLGRHCPELPCSTIFDQDEWQATCAVLKRPLELGEPSLGEFIPMIGKLGGHLGRKSDGPPGPKSIWRGLTRVVDFAAGWKASRADFEK